MNTTDDIPVFIRNEEPDTRQTGGGAAWGVIGFIGFIYTAIVAGVSCWIGWAAGFVAGLHAP